MGTQIFGGAATDSEDALTRVDRPMSEWSCRLGGLSSLSTNPRPGDYINQRRGRAGVPARRSFATGARLVARARHVTAVHRTVLVIAGN